MEIKCHSSTTKKELLDFLELYKGKQIELHFENSIIESWGDDDIVVYDTIDGDNYKEIKYMIENYYIHNIKTLN